MAEKILIIHPGTIELELAKNKKLSADEVDRGESALRTIKSKIDGATSLIVTDQLEASRDGRLREPALNGDVYLLIQDNLVVTRDCVAAGDSVTIMGAYANICCAIVEEMIDGVVDSVYIDPEGSWTISDVRQRAIGLR